MTKLKTRIKYLTNRFKNANTSETLKHLRGRHDQRDHAWNRGMGRGGDAGSSANTAQPTEQGVPVPLVNATQYRAAIVDLQQQVDSGQITEFEKRNTLRILSCTHTNGYRPCTLCSFSSFTPNSH